LAQARRFARQRMAFAPQPKPTRGQAVHVFCTFTVKADGVAAFAGLLAGLVEKSRAEPGCLSFGVHQEKSWINCFSDSEKQVFILSEAWASSIDIERHSKSEHAQRFNAALFEQKLLVCEPSLSLFGPPLTLFQLREFTLEDGAESKDGGPRRTQSNSGLAKTAPAATTGPRAQPGPRRSGSRAARGGDAAGGSSRGSSRPPSGRSEAWETVEPAGGAAAAPAAAAGEPEALPPLAG